MKLNIEGIEEPTLKKTDPFKITIEGLDKKKITPQDQARLDAAQAKRERKMKRNRAYAR